MRTDDPGDYSMRVTPPPGEARPLEALADAMRAATGPDGHWKPKLTAPAGGDLDLREAALAKATAWVDANSEPKINARGFPPNGWKLPTLEEKLDAVLRVAEFLLATE